MTPDININTARELRQALKEIREDLDTATDHDSSPSQARDAVIAAQYYLDRLQDRLFPFAYPPPPTNPDSGRPEFTGELKSGDFGPDSGYYRVYTEFYGLMCSYTNHWTGQKTWYTREAAWAAAGNRNGHVAVVGIPADD